MSEYKVSPTIELTLYFSMLIVSGLFMPIAANIIFVVPIKISLALSAICVIIGSIAFIVCSNVWTLIAI